MEEGEFALLFSLSRATLIFSHVRWLSIILRHSNPASSRFDGARKRDIITASVSSGNGKWSEIAKRLPGRIGEQIKERWINVLDPNIKKGIWTEAEMKILQDSQRELGNKWSKIAKRIPGRNENSVKNRWYNQKMVSGETQFPHVRFRNANCGDSDILTFARM